MKGLLLMYSIQTEYSRIESLMYLNYISFNNGFKTKNDTDFKMIDIAYNASKMAFILDLNSIPEKTSIMDKSNYNFMIENRRLGIQEVLLTGEMQVTLVLDESSASLLEQYSDDMSSKLKLNTSDIRDLKNRVLDKASTAAVFQFRELFVQKIFPSKIAPTNGDFMDKTIPLAKEIVSKNLEGDRDYWMNTPLRRKQ